MNRIDIEDIQDFIATAGIGYIDTYKYDKYKKEDGYLGRKKEKYIDNEYDFIIKMAEKLLEYMESEDKGKIMKKQ